MANIMQNRVDAILDPQQMTDITKHINQIIDAVPFLGNLTLNASERQTLTSLDVSNKAFVEDAIHEIRNEGDGIMPAVINAEQIQNDLTLFTQMDEIHSLLSNAIQRISDLRRIAANEAFNTSNTAYNIFAIAARTGIPGAQASYDKLKARYTKSGAGRPLKDS